MSVFILDNRFEGLVSCVFEGYWGGSFGDGLVGEG